VTPVAFRPIADFETADISYRLLPFRFMRWHDGSVLLTNECGEFEFVSADTLTALAAHRLRPTDPSYADLKAKHFLNDRASSVPLELLTTKVRTKRDFLDGFTRLHIFVATLRCDHTCAYCQVSRVTEDRAPFDMSLETADTALAWVFRTPAKELKIEFQGGEPTLNWRLIEYVVRAATTRAAAERRTVDFVIATNLSRLDDQMLDFCREHRIHLSSSLDGPADLHNANRPRPRRDSYERFVNNMHRARTVLGHDGVSALMTTTTNSLARPDEIIDEYAALGFSTIFLRPISPYGFAARTRLDKAYATPAFLAFYKRGLEHIIELNRRGVRLVESYAQILLRKMLTPFPVGYVDLQSPAGGAIGVLVYNYDGDVYASDEGRMLAEMGDYSFRLGSLTADAYDDVMRGARVRALVDTSCLETLPGCSECAFAPFCGADPVYNWATQGDPVGHRPTNEFCRRQMGILEYLFDTLRHGDAFVQRLLLSWATQ
jgi:His-Xaa-Ser system radical SAM maturase HxsB